MAQGRRLLSNTGEQTVHKTQSSRDKSQDKATTRHIHSHSHSHSHQWPGPVPASVAVPAGMSALMPTLTRCAFPSCFAYKLRGITGPKTQKQNPNTEPENSTVTPCRVCCIPCPLLLGAFATSTEDTTEEKYKKQKWRKQSKISEKNKSNNLSICVKALRAKLKCRSTPKLEQHEPRATSTPPGNMGALSCSCGAA